jgi:hypothetical protein
MSSWKIECIVGNILEVLFDSETYWKLFLGGVVAFFIWFFYVGYQDKQEHEKRLQQAAVAERILFERNHCKLIGHVVIPRFKHDGTVHKQYQCDGGIFLDYELSLR